MSEPNYFEKYVHLPEGARLYQTMPDGSVYMTGDGRVHKLDHKDPDIDRLLLPFINEGNEAYYLVGAADTGPDKPQNATAKIGFTAGHKAFVPHAHGARHYVKCEGYGGCVLFDRERDCPLPVYLPPGSLIEIPEMVSHTFFNRSADALVTLIVNTGLGIDHDQYAITLAEATRRLRNSFFGESELERLVKELTALGEFMEKARPEHAIRFRDKAAKLLRRIAALLDLS